MSIRPLSLLAASLCVLALAACAPAPQLPPSMTDAELKEVIALQNQNWWESMFPNEPMPEVEPVAYLGYGDAQPLIDACVNDADIPGLSALGGQYNFDPADTEMMDAFNRVYFACALTYPTDFSDQDPAELGWLSTAQLGWLYDYLSERSAPCLSLLGYRVSSPPARDEYVEGYYTRGGWNPYFQVTPSISELDWPIIDYHCPPPPIGGAYHM